MRRGDDALFDLGNLRIRLRQRLRFRGGEERFRLTLPDLLGLDELRQQAFALFFVEILRGLVAQHVHVLDGLVELLLQRLTVLIGAGGQIAAAGTARVDQVQIGFFQIRDATQLSVVQAVVQFIDARQPPHAKGPNRTTNNRHKQKCTRQARPDAQA
ncbi:hypothetical protein D3C72_947490 [compost metagenome]